MNIAIQVADLDSPRIDGTRVYIWHLLKWFGKIDSESIFSMYHRSNFNPELIPESFSNYDIKRLRFPFLWTQVRFAFALKCDKPERLWMPIQAIPILKPRGLQTTVTIHDLAFRKFPNHFPSKDLRRLKFLTNQAIRKSDKIIAVSRSTKQDILKYYPDIQEDKICVVHHGFDQSFFKDDTEVSDSILARYKIRNTKYVLYVGAIQPRKNIETLVDAFEHLKQSPKYTDIKLVLAGEKAWLWRETMKKIHTSKYRDDIVVTGTVPFQDIQTLYRNASLFVFPSLYEGFGLPILEAFASGVPVVCAKNSSLPEVGGDAALYFNADNASELLFQMKRLLEDENLREEQIAKGSVQLKNFSWEKCARETLEWIRG